MQNGKQPAGDGAAMLPYNFFSNLLALEEQMVSQTYTVDTINALVAQYAKCIEFYDLRKDPIKHYFMEKIQSTLANKDALKVMMESKKKGGDRRTSQKKPPPPAIVEKADEEEDEEKASKKKKSPRTSTNGRKKSGEESSGTPKNGEGGSPRGSLSGPGRYSLTDKKKERARQISYILKIENIKSTVAAAAGEKGGAENITIDLSTIVNNYKKVSEQNDMAVRQELADQEKSFKSKLDAKRKSHHWNRLNMKSRTSSFSEDLPFTMLRSSSAASVLLPIRPNRENEIENTSEKSTEKTTENAIESAKEEAKPDAKDDVKEAEIKETVKEEVPVETQVEAKVDAPVEAPVETKAEIKEEPQVEAQVEIKEAPKEDIKEANKEDPKEDAKGDAKETVNENANEDAKENVNPVSTNEA